MPPHHCVIAGHPYHPASGCLIDDPRAEPPAPPPTAPTLPEFPPALRPEIAALDGAFAVPNLDAVLRQRAWDLAGRFLSFPERESRRIIADYIYRQGKRAAR